MFIEKKRFFAACMAGVMLLLGGCGAQTGNSNTADSAEAELQTMGTLEETRIELPEDSYAIESLVQGEDGSVYMTDFTENHQESRLWKWNDADGSWEMQEQFTDYMPEDVKDGNYELFGVLSPDGTIFAYAFNVNDSTERYFRIREQSCEELSIALPDDGVDKTMPNIISHIRFSENGDLVVADTLQIFIVDIDTGEILATMRERDYSDELWYDYYVTGDTIYVLTKSGIDSYDLENGELLEANADLETFNQEYRSLLASYSGKEREIATGYNNTRLLVDDSGETLRIVVADSYGIYTYQDGNFEKALEGDVTLQKEDGGVIDVMGWVGENFWMYVTLLDGENYLASYSSSEGTTVDVDTQLTLYTLEDNSAVSQVVAAYEKENPNVDIEVEVGMTGEDGVTTSDAVKLLNTGILSGDGPDLILMDGLSVEDYIEKNMLLDLTETLGNVEGQEQLFENIAQTYATEDGVYAVPGSFSLMFAAGTEGNVAEIDIEDSAALLGYDTSQGYNGTLFSRMATVFYRAYLVNRDEIGEEDIAQFYELLEQLYSQCDDEMEESYGISAYQSLATQALQMENMGDISLLYAGVSKVVGYFMTLEDLQVLYGGQEDFTSQMFTSDGGLLYVPTSVIGVSSKSEQVEAATDFVEFYLSAEGQKYLSGAGLSVNRECMTEKLSGMEEQQMTVLASDGSSVEKDIPVLTGAQQAELLELFASASKAASTDETAFEIIAEQAVNYLSGESSLEKAAGDAYQKLNLYLAE